jgi:hypothetical protein
MESWDFEANDATEMLKEHTFGEKTISQHIKNTLTLKRSD